MIAPVGQIKPEIYDSIDPIGTLNVLKETFDIPSKMIMNRTDTEKYQQEKQAQQEEMMAAEQEKLQSEATRNNAQVAGTLAKAQGNPSLGVIQGGKSA